MKKFTDLKIIQAFGFLLIPLILIILTGEVRSSISNYAYSSSNNSFVMMLTLAGALFVYDGYVERKRYYNMILGISLIGVALTPHLDYYYLHYSFAGIFFLGSVATMIIYSSKKQRPFKILAGAFILISMILFFVFNIYSLFWAEWIGMIPISLHYVGEALGKID